MGWNRRQKLAQTCGINATFGKEDFEKMKEIKEKCRIKNGLTVLSWEDFIFTVVVNFK